MAPDDRARARAKPNANQLGVDLASLEWQRSGAGDGSFEVAFVGKGQGRCGGSRAEWVLLRVAGDPGGAVLVYDRFEWACFLDGARRGEFDSAQGSAGPVRRRGGGSGPARGPARGPGCGPGWVLRGVAGGNGLCLA